MVVMGKVVAAQGLLGWVKIQAFTEYIDSLADYKDWFLGGATCPWRPVKVVECKPHNKVLLARLEGIADRDAAEQCKGLLIAIPRGQLPKTSEEEYYWSALIGMTVINVEGLVLGKVDHLLDMGANDIMSVQGESGEILVPFLKHVVQNVSLEDKVIRVDWQADY
jgi:16S rRNA processing protein RimM